MAFEIGNTLAKGGYRPGAGRRSQREIDALEKARELFKKRLAKDADGIFKKYKTWMDDDPATCRHAVDKILGDDKNSQVQGVLNVQFVQFNNHHSVSLHTEGVPITVSPGNGNGHQAGGNGVASQVRQGQNGIEFHNFEDVSGE